MTEITYGEDYAMTCRGNFVRYVCDGVCISYNPSTNLNLDHMPETAVVIGKGKQKFYICYGDKRDYFNGANTLESIKARCRELKGDPSFWIGFWSDDWGELAPPAARQGGEAVSDKTVKEQKSPPKKHCCNVAIEDCTYTSRYAHNRCSKCKQLFPELKEMPMTQTVKPSGHGAMSVQEWAEEWAIKKLILDHLPQNNYTFNWIVEAILATAEHWGKRAAEEVLIKDGYEPIIAKAEADDWWQSVRGN